MLQFVCGIVEIVPLKLESIWPLLQCGHRAVRMSEKLQFRREGMRRWGPPLAFSKDKHTLLFTPRPFFHHSPCSRNFQLQMSSACAPIAYHQYVTHPIVSKTIPTDSTRATPTQPEGPLRKHLHINLHGVEDFSARMLWDQIGEVFGESDDVASNCVVVVLGDLHRDDGKTLYYSPFGLNTNLL